MDSISIFVNLNQYFFGLGHVIKNRFAKLVKNVWVDLPVHETVLKQSCLILCHLIIVPIVETIHDLPIGISSTIKVIAIGSLKHLFLGFLKNVESKEIPEFQTCLKNFIAGLLILLWNLLAIWWRQICALYQILQADVGEILQDFNISVVFHGVACLFDERQILSEHRRYRQTNLFAEIFEIALVLRVVQGTEFFPQISTLCHILDLLNEYAVVKAGLLLVQVLVLFIFFIQVYCRDFGEKFDSLYSSAARLDQISEDVLDQIGLENVTKRNPR